MSQGVGRRQLSATSPVLTLAHTADSDKVVPCLPTHSPRTADSVTTVAPCLPAQSPRATFTDGNHIRLVNSNIRMPLGIPPPQQGIPPAQRRDDTAIAATSVDSNDADVCDTNPLRRLRNVNTFRPMTTYAQRGYK